MTDELKFSPEQFAERLLALGTRRAAFVYEAGSVRASHPELAAIARAVQGLSDFHEHEGVFLEVGRETGALLGAFVHKTLRGQSAGGVRHWPYDTLRDYLSDGLRLARGMGRKNALAGLWWGGGKGVIARQSGPHFMDAEYRRVLYREYGRFVTSLRGVYVTAEDAGTNAVDMAHVFSSTRFVTCIPPEFGGSGNPSVATARGVVCAMEAAIEFLGRGTLAAKRVVVQGAGNVGLPLIGELVSRGVSSVVASDISKAALDAVRSRFAGAPLDLRMVAAGDHSILAEPCDVLAPNALGGVLSRATIPTIRARVVCGAANNQLADEEYDDVLLAERGITYVPDFVANRMGIVNCANEQYGCLPDDPAIECHFDPQNPGSLQATTRRVLEHAAREGITPAQAANRMADERACVSHPIWGHRGKQIIRALQAEHWAVSVL